MFENQTIKVEIKLGSGKLSRDDTLYEELSFMFRRLACEVESGNFPSTLRDTTGQAVGTLEVEFN